MGALLILQCGQCVTDIDHVSIICHSVFTDTASALVISCGYNTTHILPVLDGKAQIQDCRRINIGGQHMEHFLQRVLQLKYPGHFAHITLSRAAVS